jgi:hypothetical protein
MPFDAIEPAPPAVCRMTWEFWAIVGLFLLPNVYVWGHALGLWGWIAAHI